MRGRHEAHGGQDHGVDFEISRPSGAPVRREYRPATGVLSVSEVRYARAGRVILDGVSVTLQPGEALAVTGPSGSGKSSLLALLAGLERPDAGSIVPAPGRRGLILQGYGLVGVLTAAENVEVALQSGVLGRLRPGEIREHSAEALAAVGLTEVAGHLVEELSGGQQQRVAIARALAVQPDVVLADELTAELDHEWKQQVVDLVLGVSRRGGIVVVATHDAEIASACDRAVRLADGHLYAGEGGTGTYYT